MTPLIAARRSLKKRLRRAGSHSLGFLLAPFIDSLIRRLYRTSRITWLGIDPTLPRPVTFAFMHGDLVLGIVLLQGRSVATMVTRGPLGDLLEPFLKRLDYLPARGGTAHGRRRHRSGGLDAADDIVQHLTSGRARAAAITVDGSRGPAGRCRAGVIHIAAESGTPLVPVRAGMARGRRLDTWDRTQIPFLGRNHLVLAAAEPLEVPTDPSAARIEALQRTVETRFVELGLQIEEQGPDFTG